MRNSDLKSRKDNMYARFIKPLVDSFAYLWNDVKSDFSWRGFRKIVLTYVIAMTAIYVFMWLAIKTHNMYLITVPLGAAVIYVGIWIDRTTRKSAEKAGRKPLLNRWAISPFVVMGLLVALTPLYRR